MAQKQQSPKLLSARPRVSQALMQSASTPFERDNPQPLEKLSDKKKRKLVAALLAQTGSF